MTCRSLYIILFLLINISSASAKKLTPVYSDGLLLKIDIDKYESTGHVNNGSSNISAINNNKKNGINNYHYYYQRPTQETYIKETYYFEIRVDDLKYITYFAPIWANKIDINWVIGKPIQVRLNDKKNRLYLLRPNGKELKTTILRIANCSN